MDDVTGEWAGFNLDYKSEKIELNSGDYVLKFGDPLFERVIKAYAKLLRNWYDE